MFDALCRGLEWKETKILRFISEHGFTEFAGGRLQQVICDKVLPNSSTFLAKFKRHFETHSDFTNKTAD